MKLPNFFIIGASKAGTTSICDALARHPEICFSAQKEPNFFSEFDIGLNEIPSEKLLQYQSLFKVQDSHQLIGEGSVKYLNSSQANYWIKRYVPFAKIIIILRNPVQRVVSLYEMYTRLGKMQMSQDEAFDVNSYVVKQCLLYSQILLYIEAFSQEQVLIMTFDDFLKDQDKAFHKLCQFIGVKKSSNLFLETRNKGGIPKSNFLNLLTNRNFINLAKKIFPNSNHTQIDSFIKRTFFKKVRLKPFQREQLKSFFYEDVEKTGNLIGRDLCKEWQLYSDSEINIK